MKKILTLICTLLCANVLLAQVVGTTFWIGDIQYEITSTNPAEVEVNDANLSITTANIPETVTYQGTTNSVTSIGDNAFRDCSSLTSITIPNSVTSIGNIAFYNCSSLTSITIPNSVTSIGTHAFYGCSSLTSVTIPNSVISIGYAAFAYCSSLTSVTIPNSVTYIGDGAFYDCSSLTSIDIPNSITSIGELAFRYCTSLTSITIPNSVTSIGNSAFRDCSSLTSVTIPNSVTSIGRGAFHYCTSLESINLSDNIASIGRNCFDSCINLTNVNIPTSLSVIDTSLFRYCTSLTSVTIPENITYIKAWAFIGCSSLTSVTCLRSNSPSLGIDVFYGTPNNKTLTIPCGYESEYAYWQNATTWASIDCIVTIGSSRFTIGDLTYEITSETEVKVQDCTQSATSVVIPETVTYQGTTYSVTSIGSEAFRDCSSLTSITIPNSVTSIGSEAFENCSSLTSVTIPNSITSIGSSAFYYCSSLTSITIPNSVTSIGMWSFCGCNSLTSVTIGNSITSIGGHAFSGCSSLTSITIPNSATSIGDYAFNGCSSLTSVTIPNSVTSIGNGAFAYCSSLTSVTIGNSVTSIGDRAFSDCSSLTSITIPNSVTSIGGGVFGNCSSLTSVTLSNNITTLPCDYGHSIGFFENCSSLTSITIPNSVTSIGYSAFYGCSSLISVTCLGSNSPSLSNLIGGSVFDGTPNNKTLTIPCGRESEYTDWQNATTWASIDCIVTIGSRFTIGDLTYEITSETEVKVQDCTQSATSVVIPETATYQGTTYSVTSIGAEAFLNCSSLTSVNIPNSVTSIGYSAFSNCSSLTSVTIPNSVTSIGSSAFYGCSSLTSVIIPNSVTSFGGNAFYNCSNLTSVTIHNSVTSIGINAFYNCNSLTSMTIDMSHIIGDTTFSYSGDQYTYESPFNIPSLQNLTLGENVTSIASGAFNDCSFLQNVTCLATNPPTLEDNTVFPYPNIASLNVPCGTLEAYSAPTSYWNVFFAGRISESGYNVEVSVNDETFGSVAVESDCSTATLTATANEGYVFLSWNDGNTENPRLVSLTSDTSFVANFIISTVNTDITATICQGQTYTENGFNVSEAGTYTQTLTAINGADSIVTLTLNILPSYNTNLTATICEGSELNISGFNVIEGGVYTQSYTAVNGCDSIITLTVTELPTIHTNLTLTICEGTSLNFSGFNVSEAGIYTQNLTSVNGCDSVVTLTVSVNPTFDTTINATINAGETYAEYGFNESESGTYVQNLQSINGCDSTITLVLSVNSSLYDIAEFAELSVYPNPTSGKVTFNQAIEKIEVIDMSGKTLQTYENANEINIETLPAGVYHLRMTIEDKTIMRKVIKE